MSESLEQFPKYLMGFPKTPLDSDMVQGEDTGLERHTKPRWARLWFARSLEQSDPVVAAYEALRLALAEKVCREHGLLTDYEGIECNGGREAGSWLWAVGEESDVYAVIEWLSSVHNFAGILVDTEGYSGSDEAIGYLGGACSPATIAVQHNYQPGVLRAFAEWVKDDSKEVE